MQNPNPNQTTTDRQQQESQHLGSRGWWGRGGDAGHRGAKVLQDCLSSCLSRRSTGVLESQWGSPERQGALDAVLQGNPRGPPLPRPIILAVLLLPLGRALLGRKASGPRPSQSTHARSRENPESSPSSLLGNSEHPRHVPAPGFSGGREKCGKQLFPPVPTPSTGCALLPALSQEGCGGWGSSGAPEFGTHTFQAWNLLGMAVPGEAKWGQS